MCESRHASCDLQNKTDWITVCDSTCAKQNGRKMGGGAVIVPAERGEIKRGKKDVELARAAILPPFFLALFRLTLPVLTPLHPPFFLPFCFAPLYTN